MVGLAVLFGLLSMVGYGLANVFSQPLARKIGSAQVLFLRGFTLITILAIASVPSYHKLAHHGGSVGAAFLLGVVGYIPVLAFTHGIKISRISIVAPIAGSETMITVLLAYAILHTQVTNVQWLAIVIITLANILVAVDIRDLRKSNIANLSSGIPFALIAAVGWGAFFFGLIYPTKVIGPWLAALFVEMGVTLAAGLHIWLSKQKVHMKHVFLPQVYLNGAAICLGTVGYTIGVKSYSVPIVVTLSSSPAIISSFIGIKLFHEELKRLEIVAAAMMIVGVMVISFA